MDLFTIALIAGGAWLLWRLVRSANPNNPANYGQRAAGGSPRRQALDAASQQRMAAVRRVAEEDVTQLGEQLQAEPVEAGPARRGAGRLEEGAGRVRERQGGARGRADPRGPAVGQPGAR